MDTALISASLLLHPDAQVWRIFFPAAGAEKNKSEIDEIEQMIENGED